MEQIPNQSNLKADELVEKIVAVNTDFPAFIIFCVGEEHGGFTFAKADKGHEMDLLRTQMFDAFMNHPALLDIFKEVISRVENKTETEEIHEEILS